MGTRPQGIVTSESNYCLICGRLKSEDHHLICGTSGRKIADKDGIYIPLCDYCHKDIHHTATATKLGKMVGQLVWEREHILKGFDVTYRDDIREKSRTAFIERYGKSWL